MTIQLSRRTVALALAAFLAFAGLATASFVLTLTRTADAGVFPGSFSDTPPWIADHATWLANQGVASGFDNGTFKPNDNITRGQAAFWFGNYNNAIEIAEQQWNPPADSQFSLTATCPVGKRAIAGGSHADGSDTDLFVRDSGPEGADWEVRWESDNDATVNPTILAVYALCAPNRLP